MTEAAPIRVVLADDHALVRAGIRALLERLPDVTVVGEATDGAEAIALAKSTGADVLLLDIAMPTLNGLEAAAVARVECPDARVVILSGHPNEEYVIQALANGAVGYLLKDAAATQLDVALAAVARGETYLSPSISKRVIERYLARMQGQPEPAAPLSARQLEVLRRLAQGQSTKEIAADLEISAKTVEAHRAQIMQRLDIRDLAGLVKYAIRAGLLPPEA